MYVIEIVKYPDRKKNAICVYDTENPVTHYIIGYINHHEDLFKQALRDTCIVKYVDAEPQKENKN